MKKIRYIVFLSSVLFLVGCQWAKTKTKRAVNKSGEVVAKAGSEFGDGISKGVKKTFENNIELSDDLKNEGLELGEISVNSTPSATDNILTTYLIFNKSFDKKVTVKLFRENGKEYGRLTQEVKAKKGQTKYYDFTFDKRVNIGVKGNIAFE